MFTIKKLEAKEYPQIVEIASMAFPEINVVTQEDKNQMVTKLIEDDTAEEDSWLVGVYEEAHLVAGARYDQYVMKLLSQEIQLGGIGFLVVDFLNKKRGIAKKIVTDFIETFEAKGYPMVALYPFRPDFYKKMGFGYGTSMNQYRIKPETFPKGDEKRALSYLKKEDIEQIMVCYETFRQQNNGLFRKNEADFNRYFRRDELHLVGLKEEGAIRAYMVFKMVPVDPHSVAGYDLETMEFVYLDSRGLMALTGFLNSQKDQINRVIFNTQDQAFNFMLEDPRNHHDNMFFPFFHESNIQGSGIMYRIINVKKLFEDLSEHDFSGETLSLGVTVHDSFYPKNNGRTVIEFNKGYPVISSGDAEVEIELGVGELSSLITCSVDFNSLARLNRVKITPCEYTGTINRMFATADKPICMSRF